MSLSIFYHSDFLNHDTGVGHPERPDRLITCVSALKSCNFANQLLWKTPRPATEEELRWIHTSEHIERIKKMCLSGGGYLDVDTPVSPKSFEIALKSAGSWLNGVYEVMNKNSAFILSRPPGHHAERNRAMGFCLFSNAALAATGALKHKGVNKICIFDWDVHHGNGTQNIFYNNEKVLYISSHQYPYYPGSGAANEKGNKDNVLNVPLSAGTLSHEFLNAYESIFKKLKEFKPEFILLSAGFDAHKDDPLAQINLESKDYYTLTKRILTLAKKLCNGKVVSILEGGYNLNALKESVDYHVKSLLE